MKCFKPLLFLILITSAVIADSEKKLFNLNGHTYQRIDSTMRWDEAVQYCSTIGGHLVTITTKEENDFIYQNFGIDGKNLWIGATDLSAERMWQWVTGEPFEYNNWANRMPDNFSRGQDYAIFWDLDPGKWDDNGMPECDCKYMFVCEWEPNI